MTDPIILPCRDGRIEADAGPNTPYVAAVTLTSTTGR